MLLQRRLTALTFGVLYLLIFEYAKQLFQEIKKAILYKYDTRLIVTVNYMALIPSIRFHIHLSLLQTNQ